jgi:Mrp family chromosome partitioning ATPase
MAIRLAEELRSWSQSIERQDPTALYGVADRLGKHSNNDPSIHELAKELKAPVSQAAQILTGNQEMISLIASLAANKDEILNKRIKDKSAVFPDERRYRMHDEFLRLVQRVFAGNGSVPPKLVVFAGVEHGNGCTSVCAHVGEILSAHSDRPVCLIDANPFGPGLYRYFGLKTTGRFTSTINSESGQIPPHGNEVPGKKLWLMSCTEGITGVRYITNIDKFRMRLLELCSQFGYILIDAPPVNTNAQTLMLGRVADGVVLVLEANVTRRDAAFRAKENLESAGVKLFGVVLNKRTYPIPDSIYRRF